MIRRCVGMLAPLALASWLLVGHGCGGSAPLGLAPAARQAGAKPALLRACRLADVRCSRCHPIDRVLASHVDEPADWTSYVHRMRLTPGSGIRAEEERPIVRCLVQYSFGAQGSR